MWAVGGVSGFVLVAGASMTGRYRALAPKVSQAAGSPVCMPIVNHFWRDADEP
jgi:hypothetical protein